MICRCSLLYTGVAEKDEETKAADAARKDKKTKAEAEKEETPENDQKENRVTDDEMRDEVPYLSHLSLFLLSIH